MQPRTLVSLALGGAVALTLLTACQSEPRSIHQAPSTDQISSSPEEGEPSNPSTHAQGKRRENAAMAEPRASVEAPAPRAPLKAGDLAHLRRPSEAVDRERYAHLEDHPVKRVAEHPVSTFSIDVDTGSYANVRRFLSQGRLPLRDAVRVEEMINYFRYDYPAPREGTRPFNLVTEIAPTPWNARTHLLHIGIKGYELTNEALPPANLVFLVDISGSMRSSDKLPLLKSALKLLNERLRPVDRVSIVVYAGGAGVVLEPTAGDEIARIHAALEALGAGGRTHGAAGIRLAYAMAEQGFVDGGINRVLLATDGDFNVGTVNFEALKNLVEQKRETGISLTTLGFGTGNYNDRLMEQLADAGNGNYAYIDTLSEANKVLVRQMAGTLATIAKDVKIQIEFNPKMVAEYRLIGYENRALRREDFGNDGVDAGEIGAGHTVTALYEIALAGSGGQRLEPLRYGGADPLASEITDGELAFLRLRYKAPDGDRSTLFEKPIFAAEAKDDLASSSVNFRFAAAVAGFGQVLKGGRYTGEWGYEQAATLANGARGADRSGHRGEFVNLVHLARSLAGENVQAMRE
ncbi:MAG: VWA domain-containing protein [Gammaproteobacteria bacterium]|nr:VWA domain-containing protein [Gammaproteobacteria bacterium]NIR83139.1 VWA domain-containing protein [Gammaproteobacteria bacterium]NIR90947.1 VWA domain-containing protein [Gammaproteobacteria bacterium]NIU04304.1 VWA domain-containing protein [Gammaproteobacteria bacterium]NIV52527.1 DUF3520 domain-containing protein [Gammaproteobacteria bacterium]